MSLFFGRREARSNGGWAPEPLIPPFPGTNPWGASVPSDSPKEALQTPAVWACVRLLADTVSMLPVHAFNLDDKGRRVQLPDPKLLATPAAGETITDWLYQVMVSLLLRGNAYGLIASTDRFGYPTQIELLDPDKVHVRVDRDTRRFVYFVHGVKTPVYQGTGAAIPGQLWRLRAFSLPGTPVGLSPISYAARTIGIDLGTSDFAYSYFREGAHPTGLLSSELPVTPEQAQTVKDRFMSAIKGRQPVVVGAGITYTPIQIKPEESQFLATQKFNITQIARFFGVPAEMVGGDSGHSMTYANVEQRNIEFLTYSVQPWLKRIEDAMFPLLPGAKYVRFNTGALLRTDLETRYKSHAIGIAAKFLHPDEARAFEEMPPLTQKQKADLALVPLEILPTGMPKLVSGATDVPQKPSPDNPQADAGAAK